MTKARTVALVDDDESIRESLGALLRSAGWRVSLFPSAEEFLNSGEAMDAACLLADVNMPGMTGLELSDELRRRGHSFAIFLLTGFPDETDQERAAPLNVTFFPKPFDEEELLDQMETAASPSSF